MCITYLAKHEGCDHHHFLGTYHCAPTECPTNAQHTFHIEDSGYGCETCAALEGRQLDPDVVPVKYYSPDEHFDIKILQKCGFDRVVRASPVAYQRSEPGSLSDVDSETSYWKLDRTADEEGSGSTTAVSYGEEDEMQVPEELQPPEFSPETMQHRKLVNDQLNNLVSRDVRQTKPSPNTTQHRNLVHDQLANLPLHFAQQREPVQFMLRPSLVRHAPPPESLGRTIPPPTRFYDEVTSRRRMRRLYLRRLEETRLLRDDGWELT